VQRQRQGRQPPGARDAPRRRPPCLAQAGWQGRAGPALRQLGGGRRRSAMPASWIALAKRSGALSVGATAGLPTAVPWALGSVLSMQPKGPCLQRSVGVTVCSPVPLRRCTEQDVPRRPRAGASAHQAAAATATTAAVEAGIPNRQCMPTPGSSGSSSGRRGRGSGTGRRAPGGAAGGEAGRVLRPEVSVAAAAGLISSSAAARFSGAVPHARKGRGSCPSRGDCGSCAAAATVQQGQLWRELSRHPLQCLVVANFFTHMH
jgi:hypothetical protein